MEASAAGVKKFFSLKSLAIPFVLLVLVQSAAVAANITSLKTGSWNDPAVWSGGAVPTSSDNVTIVSPHVVSVNANGTIANLTISSGATLQFNNAATAYTLTTGAGTTISVGGTLDMGALGVLQTGAAGTTILAMTSTGTLRTSNVNGLGPDAGTSLQTQGAGAFDVTSLASAGTVNYLGQSNTTSYTITDRNYNNLSIQGAGLFTWTLAADRTIAGTLLETPTSLTLGGTQNILLGGNFNSQTTLNQGNVTFVLNGTAGQFINHNGSALGNFVINKTAGTVTTSYSATVNGSFTVMAGTFTPSQIFTINGPFTNNGTVTLSANWTYGGSFTNNGTYTPGTTTTSFTGTSPQVIGGSSAVTFGNLTINNPAGVTLNQNAAVTGTLTLTSGVFTLSSPLTLGSAATVSRTSIGSLAGTPVFGSAVNLIYTNNAAGLPAITPGTELPASPGVLNNLTLSNFTYNTTVNLAADLTVNGALTLTGAQAFLNAGGYNIAMKGNWANNASTSAFNPGTGTVTWNGAANATISGSSATTFNNLTMSFTGANTLTVSTGPTINGTLTLASGTLAPGATVIQAKGDVINNASAAAFTPGTSTLQLNGSAPQTLGGSFATSLYKLTINNSQGVSLGNNVTVNNVLTLTSGNVTTGANVLSLATAGSVTRTNGHIVGNLQKAFSTGSNVTKNFEIGSGSDYTPVSLTFPSITTAGTLTATTVTSEHPDVANSGLDATKDVNRYWSIANNGLAFTTYNATFTFVPADVDPVADPAKFEVRKLNAPTWAYTATGTRTATSTQATGLTSFSDFAVGTVIPVIPASPALLSPANGAADLAVNQTLNWNAVYGADSYGLTVATDPGFAGVVINQTGLTSTSYTIPGPLLNSTKYYWHVTATNAAGTSTPSADWNFTTIIAIPPAPGLASPADGTTGVSTTPTLTWNAATGAATYRVQIASDAGFASVVIDAPGVSGTSYTVTTPLGTSSPYYWRVNATNVGGTSPYSTSSSFTTLLAAPAVPTLVSPANAATNISRVPTLTWNPVLGNNTYGVQVATDAGFSNIVVDQVGLTGTSYTITSPLTAATIYYWHVNAANGGGTSAWTTSWSFTTRAPATITSTKTGNWNDPAVWSTGYVPSLGDAVVIASPHVVSMNAGAAISSLTVNLGGTLQFNNTTTGYTLEFAAGSAIAVNGTLDLGSLGVLKTGTSGTTTATLTGTLKTSNVNGLGPAANTSLQTQGTGTFDLSNLASSGTVNYIGSGGAAYTITDRNYNNLTLTGAGLFTWTLAADRTINGTFLAQNPNKLTIAGTQNIFLLGSYNTQFPANGFDGGTSTLVLTGTSNQFINGSPMGNVTINKTAGTVTTSIAATVNGSFTVAAGTFTPSHAFTINGPFTNNGTVTLSAAWVFMNSFTNNGTYIPGSTLSTFSGTVPQTIGGSSATSFGSLTISNAAGVTVNSNINVSGTLTVNANAILTPAQNVVINNAAAAGTITGSGTVQVTRTAATPDFSSQYKFVTNTLTNLTIDYAGSAAQTVSALTYGGLKISNAAGATLAGNAGVTGNFTNNGVFNPSTFGVSFSGTAAQNIQGTSPSTFTNMTVNKSGGSLTLGANATVNGVLTMTAGNITTGANALTVESGGSVVRGSGFVVGNLRKYVPAGSGIARSYEVGTGTAYAPVAVTFANVNTPGYLTGTSVAGDHPSIASARINPARSVNRYWSMTNSGVGFDSYDVVVNFVSTDVDAGATPANFVMDKFNSSVWAAAPVGTRTSTSTQALGLTSFSDFAVGEAFPAAIAVTASLTPFNSLAGTPSAEQSYTVAGSYLTDNITVTAPQGFELSKTSGSGFSTTPLVLTPGGWNLPATTIYVRMNSAAQGSLAGNITHVSSGAAPQSVAVSGMVVLNTYALNLTIVGNGSVGKAPDQAVYNQGASVQLTAVPQTGNHFAAWSGDLSGSANPATISMDTVRNVTATFAVNMYALNVAVVGSGSVAKSPDQAAYAHDSVVHLTATPATGYHFTGWSGDVTGTANPADVTMDTVKTVTATFAIDSYAMNITVTGNGTVTKTPDQTSYDHGSTVQLTATPLQGYYFMGWSGDVTGTTNPVTVSMDGIKNVTATFAGIKVFVTASPVDSTARVIYPNSTWRPSVAPPLFNGTDDWSIASGETVSVYVVPEVGAKIGASDLTLEWDQAALDLQNVDFTGSVFGGANLSIATWDRLGTTNRVRINASLVSPNNATIAAGDFLAKINFTLKAPVHTTIAAVAADFRTFNPDFTQSGVPVTPHPADVRAYLGDVASALGSTMGDGKIDFNDLSLWSLSYWSGVEGYAPAMDFYKAKDDIGPTMNGSFFSMPGHMVNNVMTAGCDGRIDFEDLVIFSMGYGLSQRGQLPKPAAKQESSIVVAIGDYEPNDAGTRVPITLSGGVADVRALSLSLAGQFGKFLGVENGTLLQSYSSPVSVMSRTKGNRIYVDIAVMGLDHQGLGDGGDVAVLKFEGRAHVGIAKADFRSSLNKALQVNIKDPVRDVPTTFALSQNYPNPFNPSTTIDYQVPSQSKVEIVIYNILGEVVAVLVDEIKEAGAYKIVWNGQSASGATVGTGVYFCRMHAGQFSNVKKMLLMK